MDLPFRSLFFVAVLCASENTHEDHEGLFEWGGIFEVDKGHYNWYAVRAPTGVYADENASLVILNASDNAELKNLLEYAEEVSTNQATIVKSGGELNFNTSFNLQFDEETWLSLYKLEIPEHMRIAVFMQHLPTEFENGFHYFKTASGEDVEAIIQTTDSTDLASSSSEPEPKTRWGVAVGGGFVTTTPPLLVVLWAIPRVAKLSTELLSPMFGFAAGVIFAAAVFLLLPEALLLISEGQTESYAAGSWGACILAGWFTCFAVHLLLSSFESSSPAHKCSDSDKGEVEEGTERHFNEEMNLKSKFKLAAPVLLGDWFHNFSDGLVIGVAAKTCSESFAWKMVGISVAHEIPQELSDCIVLINQAGLKWYVALVLNWLSSAATPIGAAIAYGVDVSVFTNGCILAYGAGVYLFVAISEVGPRLTEHGSKRELLARALSFLIGAVAIGLILLDHEHCSAAVAETSTGTDSSHSHSHR